MRTWPRVGDISYASLRYFNAAGADLEHGLGEDHTPETHLIPKVIAAALGREERVAVFGDDYPTPDGTCIRDYIHVRDLCQAHLLALEHLAVGWRSGVFNLGNGSGFSVREVIESVQARLGSGFQVVVEGSPPGRPAVAGGFLGEDIGPCWGGSPSFTDIDGIVETAWEWHSEHPDGYSSLNGRLLFHAAS